MQQALIVANPAVMMGKPVVAGTRITVDLVLEKLASGETIEQILDAHPRLTREHFGSIGLCDAGSALGHRISHKAISMILLADESVDRPIVQRLRHDGHDTTYVAELAPSISDDEVLREANARNALLLTEDKDFGELVYRLGRVHTGIVLIRLAGLLAAAKADTVSKVLQDHEAELIGAFTVISPGGVRIRKPLSP